MLTSRTGNVVTPISTVVVVGLGYIGLPTAAILATNGLEVIGVDVNPSTVTAVNNGDVPFVEPDLSIHVAGAVSQGRLRAQAETPHADAYIVAVPTPFKTDKSPDMAYIDAAARGIAPQLRGGELVILESTSPPGSTRRLAECILELRPDLSIDGSQGKPMVLVAHCPERVLPGRIMIELVTNDRVVGGLTPEAAEAAAALYTVFCKGEIHLTDAATAEMTKLVENAYRDVNIAFANELSVISDNLSIDVWELIRLANHHPRVNILQPGPGVGGHCIAVDPWFIVAADPEDATLIRTAREINDSKPGYVVEQVLRAAKEFDKPVIACLGLAFKANIDDVRQSPAVNIVREVALNRPEATILVAAPHEGHLPQELAVLGNVTVAQTDAAVGAAQIVVLLVGHDKFRDIQPESLAGKHVIDTRGFWR
ncbi:UDP-N-acetyl-D-mannosamine dehydrogenase [Paenarthrobacter sp. PH39-S1]|uniref:UDP-N-acetyl-D-mannosamine dehydrogenase n=1 Tax=Paenarthrobacter sp. PH39-S1 TaxID=3046204 RepID=UPI0024B9FD00|nr:UDP-N-acetyl-D-mannosamine dehydrogenase [Paenarthrobacter sp. PH39-S1]MDJ0356564.1 UDP-N-acetyl-D-mannosamine dehydrogenase [Paenarthrobacter sp. PH39-S1]